MQALDDLPAAARAFREATRDGYCRCGFDQGFDDGSHAKHIHHHHAWANGIRLARDQRDLHPLRVIGGWSRMADRKLAFNMFSLYQQESRYDSGMCLMSRPLPTHWPKNEFAIVGQTYREAKAIALISPRSLAIPIRSDEKVFREDPGWKVAVVWLAAEYRRRGVGSTFMKAIAEKLEVDLTDLALEVPLSPAAEAMAMRLDMKLGYWDGGTVPEQCRTWLQERSAVRA